MSFYSRWLVLLIIASTGIWSCDEDPETDAEVFTYPILEQCVRKIDGYYYIAQMLPMAFLGENFEPSIILAISEINTAGGINGKPLGLIACDTEADPARGEAIMNELATVEQLGGVVGPGFSSIALQIIDEAVAHNVVMISPSATSAALTTAEDNGFFFRTTASDALYARVAAKMADAAQFESVFIIHPDDDWGKGVAAEFKMNYQGYIDVHAYDPNIDNFSTTAISAAKDVNPEAVYLVTYPNHTEVFFKSAIAIGDFNPNWISYGQHAETIASIGSYLNGLTGVLKQERENDPSFQLFQNNFAQAFGISKEPVSDPYDAVYILAIAMSLSQNPADGIQVRDNLANISTGDIVRPGQWAQIIATLPTGQMNFEGASGPVDFDENGDIYFNFHQWIFQDGEFMLTDCWSWEGILISCTD